MSAYRKFSDALHQEEPSWVPKVAKPPKLEPVHVGVLGDLGTLGGPQPLNVGAQVPVGSPDPRSSNQVDHLDIKAIFPTDPQWWRDEFEERAALRQYDGLYTREMAERLAWGELQIRWHMAFGERVPHDLCAGCGMPIGTEDVLDQIDGARVHIADDYDCLIRYV
jgi:hypothetical protein